MPWFSARVTVDREYEHARNDDLIDRLANYHAAIGAWPDGRLSAQMSLTAESMPQAAARALEVMQRETGADPIALELMTEAEFYAREGFEPPAE